MVDVITKKQNGVVFTPEWVVAFMVEEVFRGRSITGNEKILDAGCGDGIFAALATRVFSDLSGKSVKDVIENNIYFIDVSAEYVEKTKERLRSLSKETVKKFNAVVGDFCFHDFHNHFDLIIGNPPYVRIQNLNDRRELLQKRYISTSNGSIDLYFCFFERALQLLSNNGAISFITPNSHIYSAAGRHLRMILLPHVTKIINFDHFQIFKDATAYTAITFLQKQKTRDFLYANHHAENLGNIKYKKILSENMRTLRWEFFDEEHVAKITHLSGMYSTLHDVADIHYGIATLKDDIYIFSPDKTDSEYFYRADFKIERDLCVPIIKASTYKGKNQDLFLFFLTVMRGLYRRTSFAKNSLRRIYILTTIEVCLSRGIKAGQRVRRILCFWQEPRLADKFWKENPYEHHE